jgi:hypothetical protein
MAANGRILPATPGNSLNDFWHPNPDNQTILSSSEID